MGMWIAKRLDGTETRHASRAALGSAKKRAHGTRTIVDSWPESDPPPFGGTAQQWDDYRSRRGYAGG